LRPLFSIRQKRLEGRVLDDTGQPFALLSLDEVLWQAAGQEERGWELEIELLPGADEAILRRLAAALEAMPDLTPQASSKYERGMALLEV
jgi:inorganic triphosphatase YgiF